MIEQIAETDPKLKSGRPEQFVDTSFLRELTPERYSIDAFTR